jgi:hypothetical protein
VSERVGPPGGAVAAGAAAGGALAMRGGGSAGGGGSGANESVVTPQGVPERLGGVEGGRGRGWQQAGAGDCAKTAFDNARLDSSLRVPAPLTPGPCLALCTDQAPLLNRHGRSAAAWSACCSMHKESPPPPLLAPTCRPPSIRQERHAPEQPVLREGDVRDVPLLDPRDEGSRRSLLEGLPPARPVPQAAPNLRRAREPVHDAYDGLLVRPNAPGPVRTSGSPF